MIHNTCIIIITLFDQLLYQNEEELIRIQELYKELETAYTQQQKELTQLQSVHQINQNSSQNLKDQLNKSQQQIVNLQYKIKMDDFVLECMEHDFTKIDLYKK